VNEVISYDMELESFGDDLLNKFANSVEEDNRVKGFGVIICRLIWLGYNHHGGTLEVAGLGQCPKLMHTSTMLMMWDRHTSCLRMVLRCRHISLSGLDAEELLHLINAHLNSSFENGTQVAVVLDPISLRTSVST